MASRAVRVREVGAATFLAGLGAHGALPSPATHLSVMSTVWLYL